MCLPIVFILATALFSPAFGGVENVIPPGHMKPFGSHMDPMPLEETEDIPDAKTFFEKYVLPMRPIVFRNAAKKFRAFTEWTEDYLVKNFGDLEVRLENKLEKEGYTPAGAKGVGRDTIEEFVRTFKDSEKYIVSELPSPMYKDMMVLPCMSCGPIRKRMVEVDLWMSSGSSQSILHKDAFNTMNCLINGTKDWKIILYKHEKDLYKAYEDGDPGGGYSKINVRSVDMLKYPKIATVPYYNISVHGGDCLYLPKSTYHQVNSLPGFNLAVTILFSRFDFDRPTNFNDCNETTEKFTPLTEFDVDWQYPGKGYMTMGYSETRETKSNLYNQAKSSTMRAKDVLEMLQAKTDFFTGEPINEDYITKLFGIKKGDVISKQHVARLKKPQLRKLGAAMQGLFTSNSYDYEYYKISPLDIAKLISALVKRDGVLKKDIFVESYSTKLYGTKLYGDELFKKLSGDSAHVELSKEDVVKSFADAVSQYVGDDQIEDYDPNAKYGEKEDRGDAYIFVRKDLEGMETDKDLVDSLKSLIKDGGEGDGQDDDGQDDSEEGGSEVDDDEDGRPEDQDEDSMEEEVIEYREEDGEPEIDNEEEPESMLDSEPKKQVGKDTVKRKDVKDSKRKEKDEL